MDMKSSSDFFSVIGVHVTKYIFYLRWFEGCLKKANASAAAAAAAWEVFHFRKALPGFFPLYFQLPYLPEETCFHQAGSSVVEGTSQAGCTGIF
jgi:hypothetical protein